MKQSETVEIIEMLRTAYPKFIQTSDVEPDLKQLLNKTIKLWHECLKSYAVDVCRFAVMRYIAEGRFPPTINDIVTRIQEALEPERDGAAVDAWNLLKKCVARGVTREQFDALPYEIRRFCGSASALNEMGYMESAVFNSVTRGQFMKVYDGMKRAGETIAMMPPEVRALVQSTVKEMPPVRRLPEPDRVAHVPSEPIPFTPPPREETQQLTPEEWAARRDKLIEQFDEATKN